MNTKNLLSVIAWIVVVVVGVGLYYDLEGRKSSLEQNAQLISKANREIVSFFDVHQQDKNKIGYFKSNWKKVKGDSLAALRSIELVYENSQALRERIDAFKQEMIQLAPSKTPLFLSDNAQGLLQDSLQTYHYNIITKDCKDCQLGRDAYSESELELWSLEQTLPIIWNTALLTLEAKTWLLQHRTIDFHTKSYLSTKQEAFPFNSGRVYVEPEFRIVEEGKPYKAKVFFGTNVPTLSNYLSMKTDFTKVRVSPEGKGRVMFTTWTSSFDDTGEFHKIWEGDIYLMKDFLLLSNNFNFKDTTFKAEDDYMLLRELF